LRGGASTGDAGIGGSALAVLALAFCGLWVLLNVKEFKLFKYAHEVALALVILLTAISVLTALVPQRGVMDLARLLSAAAVCFAVGRAALDRKTRGRILTAMLASALVPLYFGAAQLVQGVDRLEGTLAQPNSMGFFLAMVLILGTAVWFDLGSKWKWALGVMLVVAAVELLFTYSRGGWLAAMTGITVVCLLRSKKLLVFVAFATVMTAMFVPSATERVQEVQGGRQLSGYGENTLLWRLDYWAESLSFSDGNRLGGIGFGMTRYYGSGVQPHNDFVRMFVETGVFGLIAFVAFLATVFRLAFRALRAPLFGIDRGIAVGLIGVTFAYSTYSLSGNLISYPIQLWFFFSLIGLGAAALVSARNAEGVKL
jgi:O-antigen ligase